MIHNGPQTPLTLFEGTERVGVFSTEVELFSAVEAPDIGNYTVVDSLGRGFEIRLQRRRGWLEKVADALGASGAMTLVPQGTKHDS